MDRQLRKLNENNFQSREHILNELDRLKVPVSLKDGTDRLLKKLIKVQGIPHRKYVMNKLSQHCSKS